MNRFMQVFFIALLASIIVASAVLVFPAYHKNKNLTQQKIESKQKLIDRQLEYIKLRQTFANVTTKTDEVEKIAREKFNLCKPQETIYKFPPSNDSAR